MKDFKVIIDCDDVLNNLQERVLQTFNIKYGKNFTMDMFVDYDIFKCMQFEDAERYCELWNDENIVTSLQPIKDSQWGVKHFVDEGFDVYVATATSGNNFRWKELWLNNLYPFVNDCNIMRICDKSLLRADIMIDDYPKNLISNMYCERILLDKPWNRHMYDIYEEVYGIYRCHNWNEIVSTVDMLYKKNNI